MMQVLARKKYQLYRLAPVCLLIFFQLSGFNPVCARHPDPASSPGMHLNFFTYTRMEGLPGNSVYGFFQDSRKFIWIRTGDGLSRYDGVEFQNFLYTSKDSNSIAGNDIRSICEMPGDLIFIGTTNGLCVYNNRINRFENWRVSDKAIKAGSKSIIFSISIDTKKNAWINYNGNLDVYDSLFRFKFRYTDTEQGKLLKGIVTSQPGFSFEKNGGMWLLNDNFGLVHIDSGSLKATCYKNMKDPVYQPDIITGHYLDRNKSLLWYSPWGLGLCRYDLKKKLLKQYLFKRANDFDINLRNVINCIIPYRNYLLCASNAGLIVFDTLDDSYSVLTHDKNNPFSIPDDGIQAMKIDKDSILWIATSMGICKSNLNENLFGFISEELKEHNTRSLVEINHFTVYASEWVIIGTENDGLYSYNLKTHQRKHYIDKNTGNAADNYFGKVFIDRENRIWVSTYFGLRIYNLKKNKIENPPFGLAGLHTGICIAFLQDSHHGYWMSYEGDPRLIHCVYEGHSRYRFEKFFYENGSFPLTKINRIREDAGGNIWISTPWACGFIKWTRSDNSFTRFPKVKSPDEYLSESVMDLLPDHGDSIWIASGAGHGLIAYDYMTNRQHNYTTDNGLISNNLISLYKHHDKIWISTDNGISQFDPLTGKFINFSQEDGLPEINFTRKFVYDTASGLLFASTPHYIIYFDPDIAGQHESSESTSEIYLRKFQVNGNNQYQVFSGVLHLSYNENNVSLEYSCINFIEGDKISFEYQLEGLDRKWNQCGKRRFVTYANLDPGTYRFQVRTTIDAVNYSIPVSIASFVIAPPFYFTWWFMVAMTMVVLSAGYSLYKYRRQNREALVAVRDRISRDLHDDIGSTLNSISIYSEIAKLKTTEETQREKFLEIIGNSSRDMIDQINDIVWTVNPVNDRFENILLRMRSLASELSEGKSISIIFHTPENFSSVTLGMNERKNFYLIFKEALNNAIKYSDATEVKVSVTMKENILTLAIQDNGVGFDPSQQAVVTPGKGGNGLRNMKVRAGEIKADLRIQSVAGGGTTVELNMKV